MKKKYTAEEVATLIAAYKLSDGGHYSIAEVKFKNPNSFGIYVESAARYLEKANLTIAEQAEIWFKEVISKEFAITLRVHNPATKGKTNEEIYTEIMLKR